MVDGLYVGSKKKNHILLSCFQAMEDMEVDNPPPENH